MSVCLFVCQAKLFRALILYLSGSNLKYVLSGQIKTEPKILSGVCWDRDLSLVLGLEKRKPKSQILRIGSKFK